MNDKLLKKLILEEIENIIEEAETSNWDLETRAKRGEKQIRVYERSGLRAVYQPWSIIAKQLPQLISTLETVGNNVKNVDPNILKQAQDIAGQIRQLHLIKLDNAINALMVDIMKKAQAL